MEPLLYQSSHNHEHSLKAQYQGTKLADLQAPAAILDIAVIRKNCNLMLDTTKKLDVQFRAHIKTHKTIQGSKLQVGETGPVRLVVSTVAELEHISPWLTECVKDGREVSVLYGVPATPSSIRRLAKLANELNPAGNGHIAFMVDHQLQIEEIDKSRNLFPIGGSDTPVYIKIDTGYGRAGVEPASKTLKAIQTTLAKSRAVHLMGLYSHLGHSYGFSTPMESLEGLMTEFDTLHRVAETTFAGTELTLSVGATPTATAAQVLVDNEAFSNFEGMDQVKARWTKLKQLRNKLEIHAGVYPFLDMQQLATQARTSNLSEQNIALRVLVEVASLYTERSKPEALIAAGSLALGREPCKSYSGWGVVSPWSSLPRAAKQHTYSSSKDKRGWIVGRTSQEHGILTWEGEREGMRELEIGEKLMVWPNHACVAGAGFGWYFIVDSDVDGGETVQDVWVRCRGW